MQPVRARSRRAQTRWRAAVHFEEPVVNDLSGLRALGPEIHAIDCAVRKPERAMMRMITILALGFLHRPVARHRRAAGAEQRVEVNMRRALEAVFGEELAVDFDPELVRLLGDLDAIGGENRRRKESGQG